MVLRGLAGIAIVTWCGCHVPAAPAASSAAVHASARPAALAAPAPPEDDDTTGPVASPLGDDTARSLANLYPQADAFAGKRVRRPTAVLLFSPRLDPDPDPSLPPAARVFQPLVCSIAGKRITGARCGEVMPARATIRTPGGPLVVARSTRPFHDEAGGRDYPAPYGPACCMYNTCVGRTVPYRAALGARLAGAPGPILAVWPADADLALEVARDGVAAGVTPPLAADQRVESSFQRGARSYAALRSRHGGALTWNLGAGWVVTHPDIGPRGYTILATSDVDHDGHLELIAHERWANDYGLDVFGDAPAPLYAFSCGNI